MKIFPYPLHSTPPLGVPVGILPYRVTQRNQNDVATFRQNTGIWWTDNHLATA